MRALKLFIPGLGVSHAGLERQLPSSQALIIRSIKTALIHMSEVLI